MTNVKNTITAQQFIEARKCGLVTLFNCDGIAVKLEDDYIVGKVNDPRRLHEVAKYVANATGRVLYVEEEIGVEVGEWELTIHDYSSKEEAIVDWEDDIDADDDVEDYIVEPGRRSFAVVVGFEDEDGNAAAIEA